MRPITETGNQTDCALLLFALRLIHAIDEPKADDNPIEEIRNHFEDSRRIVKRFPFDSERKFMALIVANGDTSRFIVKGAPELLLEK